MKYSWISMFISEDQVRTIKESMNKVECDDEVAQMCYNLIVNALAEADDSDAG